MLSTMKFLFGFNPPYESSWNQIISLSTLPYVNEAFYHIHNVDINLSQPSPVSLDSTAFASITSGHRRGRGH